MKYKIRLHFYETFYGNNIFIGAEMHKINNRTCLDLCTDKNVLRGDRSEHMGDNT